MIWISKINFENVKQLSTCSKFSLSSYQYYIFSFYRALIIKVIIRITYFLWLSLFHLIISCSNSNFMKWVQSYNMILIRPPPSAVDFRYRFNHPRPTVELLLADRATSVRPMGTTTVLKLFMRVEALSFLSMFYLF